MMSFTYETEEEIQQYSPELENRIRNLLWTVSGDYSLTMKPDVRLFLRSKELALYEGIKQGAYSAYFDRDAVSMYLIRKIYLGADEAGLTSLAQLCFEEASAERILKERPGVRSIRKKAMENILDHDFEQMPGNRDRIGQLRLAMLEGWIREMERQDPQMVRQQLRREERLESELDLIRRANGVRDTNALIRIIDDCYNSILDPAFVTKYGDLEKVQSVSLQELTENGWEDYLSEELYEEALEEILENLSQQTVTLQGNRSENASENRKKQIIRVTPEMQEKAEAFVELNYGKSYLSAREKASAERLFCRGIHGGCRLHYTEGILKNPVKRNYQYEYAVRLKKKNELLYRQNYSVVKQNITQLQELLGKALTAKNESQMVPSDRGMIVPSRLWRAGRTPSGCFFDRELKGDSEETVVEILVDASGSQMNRQSQVALQAFMISRALSQVRIPHQVMSYCTFWDYTILHRMRDFEDPMEADQNIFSFVSSSNNRDGLALRAAGYSLMCCEEEKKILIVLSDGRPNDAIVKRPAALLSSGSETGAAPYTGDTAVTDTASEVRRLRSQGIHVLGVFHGDEKDLEAERRIFGRDFAYIRDIHGFSRIVGRYLMKQLESS